MGEIAFLIVLCIIALPFLSLLLSALFSNTYSPSSKPPDETVVNQEQLLRERDIAIQQKRSETLQKESANAQDVQCCSQLLNTVLQASKRPLLKGSRIYSDFETVQHGELLTNPRLRSAIEETIELVPPFAAHAFAKSASHPGVVYEVTLDSCTCPHFQHRREPCKHMYRLAMELGLLLSHSDKHYQELMSVASDVRRKQITADEGFDALQKLKRESFQTAPHLAALWAEHEDLRLKQQEDALRYKAHAAPKAADQIKAIRAEHRTVVEENRLLRHQLDFLRANLPWLEDYMELTVDEVQAAAAAIENESEYASEYESLHRWLSQEEYLRLSDAQRYQLALNRYTARSRSNWEAGIDYERYIGYLFEKEGLHVNYSGATTGKEDMGRDLIVRRGKQIKIIQCKRYSREKQIHENTVFQLYGSCVQYQLEHPGAKVTGAIYTTTLLSDVARACAQAMGIEVHEDFPLQNYPMIKCNIGNDGVKRFHLPFSQMYDRLHISPAKGDFYAATVQEAMDAGFVKAKRWTGNNP